MASMEGKTDGLLFVWPRVLGSKVDLHKTVNFNWYSKSCPGKYLKKTFASFSSKTFKCYMIKVLQKLIVPQLCFSRREEDWQDVGSVGQLMEEELTNHCVRLDHTLSIWLEVEFTSDVFLKTSVCAHYSQIIFKNK